MYKQILELRFTMFNHGVLRCPELSLMINGFVTILIVILSLVDLILILSALVLVFWVFFSLVTLSTVRRIFGFLICDRSFLGIGVVTLGLHIC